MPRLAVMALFMALAVTLVVSLTTVSLAQGPVKFVVKPATQKIEAQISRLMRWLENQNESQTFGAQFRIKAVDKIKHLPVELILGPALECLKKTNGKAEYEICVRTAYAPSP
jgi:hypothetical protein